MSRNDMSLVEISRKDVISKTRFWKEKISWTFEVETMLWLCSMAVFGINGAEQAGSATKIHYRWMRSKKNKQMQKSLPSLCIEYEHV
jgi:hypothetical protein